MRGKNELSRDTDRQTHIDGLKDIDSNEDTQADIRQTYRIRQRKTDHGTQTHRQACSDTVLKHQLTFS